MSGLSDYERTIAFSEAAIQRIRVHHHPAYPRNYEFWYTYATGYNAALNRAINEALERAPQLSEAELDLLYETYLSPLRLSERVDHIGTRILAEISEVADLLKNARQSSADYAETLERLSGEAGGLGETGRLISTIAKSMLDATGSMIARTRDLENQLAASHDEMQELHNTLEVIRAESLTDPLTGLANRKFFQGTLDRSLADAANGERFSLIVVDIDHFKAFNDNYGHLTGDQVLRIPSVKAVLRWMLKSLSTGRMDRHTDSGFERLEIVETGRRRRWTEAAKERIVLESLIAPRQISATARRHNISRSLLLIWRRAFLARGEEAAGFVPAVVTAAVPSAAPEACRSRTEIVLRCGRRIIVEGVVDAEAVLALARGLEGIR